MAAFASAEFCDKMPGTPGRADWQPAAAEQRPLRIVWVLEALPKRRNDWTANEIQRFRAARLLLKKRCYP